MRPGSERTAGVPEAVAGRVPLSGLARAALAAAALLAATAVVPAPAAGQSAAVRYDVSFDNRAHHEARVVAEFRGLAAGPADVVMPRSSPGRYALHEFAKNVYAVRVEDGSGAPLEAERVSPWRWRVADHDGTVRLHYTLFADHADGTFSGIDGSHAHLNMPASFVFMPALADRPIEIRFRVPSERGWRVATQLLPTDDPFTFTAPDLAYFLDSPTELSAFQQVEWGLGPAGGDQTIRLAVHHQGTPAEVERFAVLARAVMAEQAAIYGGYPTFDHGSYTFIACYLPWVYGDGMEHRNSTILTSRRPLEGDGAVGNLGTLSHEFFHAWLIERIRPASLEPFDFVGPNVSSELWFGEGFTSYYDGLTIVRAGVRDAEAWAADLGRLLDATYNAPGRRFRGPAAMSRQAVFVDQAAWVDATNEANTFLSYYTYGAALAAGLDLLLRTRYDTSLDALMRLAWRRFGEPEVPFTNRHIEQMLGVVTGDTAFAGEFFRRSVYGSALPDYGLLLAEAGFVLRPARPDAAVLGVEVEAVDGALEVTNRVRVGTPAYDLGIDRGTVLTAVAGRPLRRPEDLTEALDRADPGDVVEVRYTQRGREGAGRVALAQDPTLEVVTFEAAGEELSPEASALREAWLGSRAAASPTVDADPMATGQAAGGNGPGWRLHRTPTSAEFRGLSAVDGSTVWAVGSGGVWVRTTDGGGSWETGEIPGAESLFLVGAHAVSADTAHVLGTHFDGGLARVYRTDDGGASWRVTFEDAREGAFYDGMAFWDARRGVIFGDALDGRMTVAWTEDGESWSFAERVPEALEGEGGFAASGRAVTVAGTGHGWIGTGVADRARVLRTTDGGRSWSAFDTPLPAGPTSGVFAVAFRDTLNGVAVGGNYQDTASTAVNVIRTTDGGESWELTSRTEPGGVRYGAAWATPPEGWGSGGRVLVAVGPSGSGWAPGGEGPWRPLSPVGLNTVDFRGAHGWAAGVRGVVARWVW